MTESASAPSSQTRFASPEAYLAELDKFVQRVLTPGQRLPDDAATLHVFLAEAESYLHTGHYEVATVAYERLLTVMRQLETASESAEESAAAPTTAPATTPTAEPMAPIRSEAELPAVAPAPAPDDAEARVAEPASQPPEDALAAPSAAPSPSAEVAPPMSEAGTIPAATVPVTPLARTVTTSASPGLLGSTGRRRIVHVERKKIRPYRSPEARTPVTATEVGEIERAPSPAGYRPLATIPFTTGRPSAVRRWLPVLIAIIVLGAVALGSVVYRDTLMGLVGLGKTPVPTKVAAVGRTVTAVGTPVPVGRTPSAIKLPTNIVTTHGAPTNTTAARSSATTADTKASVSNNASVSTNTPAPSATATVAPSITPTPTNTPTPAPTDTATPTPTITPTATSVMVFTGPDPLAGTTGVLFNETFDPKVYYWGVGVTGFSRSRITDGALEMSLKNRNAVVWLFAGVPDIQDFFAMITVTSPNCDGGDHFGLNFRAVNDGTQLLFGITCDGRYRLQERQNGAARLLVLPTPSDAVKTGPGAVNELGVRGEGKQISLYVNRQFLTRVEVTALTKGRFGAYANSAATADLTARFDNFIAWGMQAP